jgi:hypothetical protein
METETLVTFQQTQVVRANKSNNLRCPICKQPLAVVGQDYLETLCEHVQNQKASLKSRYECINEKCIAENTGMCWNQDGEYYSPRDGIFQSYPFIDNNNSPFGSYQRQANVEICKKDENFTLLNLHYIVFFIHWTYKSNKEGDILSKSPKLVVCIRDHGSLIQYVPGISMLLFCFRQYRDVKDTYIKSRYRDNPCILGPPEDVAKGTRKWDKRWWKRLFEWYVHTFDKKFITEVKQHCKR